MKNLFRKKSKVVPMKNYSKEADRLLELDETEKAISS